MTMTRTEFLAALEQLLASLPDDERKDALAYYEDYLDAAGPEHEAQAIAELGTPEEVARKILDEQTPNAAPISTGSSAEPTAMPAAKKQSHWRMWLGGCVAVLALCLFFFQHSSATPVQPTETVQPASEIPAPSAADSSSLPENADSIDLGDLADVLPVTIPADDLGESTLNIPLEKLNRELKLDLNYGSVVFVTDPSLTSDKYATFQFDNFPHSPILRSTGDGGRTTLTYEMPENWQVAEDAPEAVLTITIPADTLNRLVLNLEQGDAHLSTLQLQILEAYLDTGSLYADSLTVGRNLEASIPLGRCDIRLLSGAKYANISVYGGICIYLDGEPEDYTIDARTDNVVRVGKKRYDKRYLSAGSNGTVNLYAKGYIQINPLDR